MATQTTYHKSRGRRDRSPLCLPSNIIEPHLQAPFHHTSFIYSTLSPYQYIYSPLSPCHIYSTLSSAYIHLQQPLNRLHSFTETFHHITFMCSTLSLYHIYLQHPFTRLNSFTAHFHHTTCIHLFTIPNLQHLFTIPNLQHPFSIPRLQHPLMLKQHTCTI